MKKILPLLILVALVSSCSKTFVDPRDDQSYTIAEIKGRWWTTQNMNYAVNGYQYFNRDRKNEVKSGKMYSWNMAQQVCPQDWHLPTDKELIDALQPYGNISYSGTAEQYVSIFGSYKPRKTEVTYTKLINDKKIHIPVFPGFLVDDQRTMFWTSVSSNDKRAYAIYWRTKDHYIDYNSVHFSDYPKDLFGFCRCVRDQPN